MTARFGAAPVDLAATEGACRVRKLPIPVQVAFATAPGIVATLEGAVRHEAADAILTGVHGERWPVRRDAFLASYDAVAPTVAGQDGAYVKRASGALALRLVSATDIAVGHRDGVLQGRPGDWLLQYDDGRRGIVRDPIFRATYVIVQPEPKPQL